MKHYLFVVIKDNSEGVLWRSKWSFLFANRNIQITFRFLAISRVFSMVTILFSWFYGGVGGWWMKTTTRRITVIDFISPFWLIELWFYCPSRFHAHSWPNAQRWTRGRRGIDEGVAGIGSVAETDGQGGHSALLCGKVSRVSDIYEMIGLSWGEWSVYCWCVWDGINELIRDLRDEDFIWVQ